MKIKIFIAILLFCGWSYGCYYLGQKNSMIATPYSLLGFYVPTKDSSAHKIRAAQAELCRHEIECAVDGKFGKQTAIGICILLDRIEKGMK